MDTESDSEEPNAQKPPPTIRKSKNSTAAKITKAKEQKIIQNLIPQVDRRSPCFHTTRDNQRHNNRPNRRKLNGILRHKSRKSL